MLTDGWDKVLQTETFAGSRVSSSNAAEHSSATFDVLSLGLDGLDAHLVVRRSGHNFEAGANDKNESAVLRR